MTVAAKTHVIQLKLVKTKDTPKKKPLEIQVVAIRKRIMMIMPISKRIHEKSIVIVARTNVIAILDAEMPVTVIKVNKKVKTMIEEKRKKNVMKKDL